MKKVLAILLMVTLVLSFVGCAPKEEAKTETATPAETKTEKVKIGVSIANFDDTFLTYMVDGMKAYAEANSDKIEIEFVDAKEDMAKQMDQVENFIIQQKDAIIVVPVDTSAAGPLTSAAKAENIPLVYVNRNPGDLAEGTYYVGSEEIVAGRLQMEFLVEALGEKGKIAILMGKLDNEGAIKRTEGNKEVAAKYPGFEIVDEQTGKWQRNDGMMVTEDWLNKFGEDLDAILCNNDDMALGAIQALKDSGRTDVLVLGVDATPDGIAALEAGTLAATVFQDAKGQGGGGVEVAYKAATGASVDQETWIPFKLVTPENVSEFK
jgi:inositol transport system substrate-binding protein